jgi:hypothetical protein
MTAEELLSAYKTFGEDPWISDTPTGAERFSASEYAGQRSQQLCLTARDQAEQAATPVKPIHRTPGDEG